ncbi:MAG: hypothetical protein IJ113_05810 [Eggerthellaceae bacterium]|nr:hypothetical protein [Eggerthellaceae bacterium]
MACAPQDAPDQGAAQTQEKPPIEIVGDKVVNREAAERIQEDGSSEQAQAGSAPVENSSESKEAGSSDKTQSDASASENISWDTLAFPTAWLISPIEGIDVGTAVELLYAPDFEIRAHQSGEAISEDDQRSFFESEGIQSDYQALIKYGENIIAVDPSYLLLNLPDMLPEAVYNIVYSYASTSNCGGLAIPGITGEQIEGYVYAQRPNPYWNIDCYIAPCAYYTTLKLKTVTGILAENGYKLLVYDAYRPMRAQWALSHDFEAAYHASPDIQAALGGWALAWYVADGPSGHNFGTDADVGVCNIDGEVIPMPTVFDTFSDEGHLTYQQLDPSAISPELYTDAVSSNEACMTLHAAFRSAGFYEVASEWWHFGDASTESQNMAIVGSGGLDFIADIPAGN